MLAYDNLYKIIVNSNNSFEVIWQDKSIVNQHANTSFRIQYKFQNSEVKIIVDDGEFCVGNYNEKGYFQKKVAINVQLPSSSKGRSLIELPDNFQIADFAPTVYNNSKNSIGWAAELNKEIIKNGPQHIPQRAIANLYIKDVWDNRLCSSFSVRTPEELELIINVYSCFFCYSFSHYSHEINQTATISMKINPIYTIDKELKFTDRLCALQTYLVNEKKINPPKCFISYAWEVDERKKENQQKWLIKFRDHLLKLNVKVFLDLRDMELNMDDTMKFNIIDSDFIFIICTPRYKLRIQNTISNARKELDFILKKKNIIPIIYEKEDSDNLYSVVPEEINKYITFDFTNPENYFKNMIGYENPKGIIPVIFRLNNMIVYEAIVTDFC